jgi:hypothetical protein
MHNMLFGIINGLVAIGTWRLLTSWLRSRKMYQPREPIVFADNSLQCGCEGRSLWNQDTGFTKAPFGWTTCLSCGAYWYSSESNPYYQHMRSDSHAKRIAYTAPSYAAIITPSTIIGATGPMGPPGPPAERLPGERVLLSENLAGNHLGVWDLNTGHVRVAIPIGTAHLDGLYHAGDIARVIVQDHLLMFVVPQDMTVGRGDPTNEEREDYPFATTEVIQVAPAPAIPKRKGRQLDL